MSRFGLMKFRVSFFCLARLIFDATREICDFADVDAGAHPALNGNASPSRRRRVAAGRQHDDEPACHGGWLDALRRAIVRPHEQGRQIMWAWLLDNPTGEKEKGWSGVYGLPRSVWLGEDGTLRMAPVKELETLRCHEKSWNNLALADGEAKPLEGVVGDSCELALEIDAGTAQRCGLKVRASKSGEEETLLYYDAAKKELVFDSTRSGKEGRKVVEHAPFALKPGEPLKLRVFVDKSVVEVYANDRQAICRRVYPTRGDSLGVVLIAQGGTARFQPVRAWEMAPANPY